VGNAAQAHWVATRRTLWGDAIIRLRRNPGALVGLVALSVLVVIAILAPLLAPFDAYQMSVKGRLEAPSALHWLGTDVFGRDMLSRLIMGSRISLLVGSSR